MTSVVNLCGVCRFALNSDNEVVRAVAIRQGGPHNKPELIRGHLSR